MAMRESSGASIREHMEVLSSDGQHIGMVDTVDGNRIKLTRQDPQSGGQHHYIPFDWVSNVDQHVHLTKNAQEAMSQWLSDNSAGA